MSATVIDPKLRDNITYQRDNTRYLLPTASATAVGDMRAPSSSASDNSTTSCDRTATINTGSIGGATTAILIVRITRSPSVITTTTTGYNCSPSNDRSPTIGGTTSNCTASNCAASSCTASALGPDLHDLTFISRNHLGEVFWK